MGHVRRAAVGARSRLGLTMSSVRFIERPNNTPEQVAEYLHQALELTEHADPPADLRAAFFTAAANLFASKQIMAEQIAPAGMFMPGGGR